MKPTKKHPDLKLTVSTLKIDRLLLSRTASRRFQGLMDFLREMLWELRFRKPNLCAAFVETSGILASGEEDWQREGGPERGVVSESESESKSRREVKEKEKVKSHQHIGQVKASPATLL